MSREEVHRLWSIWKFYRSNQICDCVDHKPERKKVCNREQSWRNYVKARDELLGPFKLKEEKTVDLDSLFDSFDNMPEN